MNRDLPKGIMPLSVGGMEACWMFSAFCLLEARTAPETLPAAWLMLGIPLAFALGRLARAFSRPLRSAAGLAGGLVWLLLLMKFSAFAGQSPMDPAWLAAGFGRIFRAQGGPNALQLTVLAAAAAWTAGLRLAAIQAGFAQILSEFQFGLLILLLVFFCAAQWEIPLPALTPVVLVFFALFLLGASSARSGDTGGWLQGEARAGWLAVLGFNAALILGAGGLLTAGVTPEVLARILGFLQALWDTMTDWVIRFIAFLARLIPQPEIKSIAIGGGAGPSPQDPRSLPDLLSIPDDVRRIAALLVSAFWVVLFAVCLWRVASQVAGWLRRRMSDMDGAQIETLPGSFRQDWLRLLRYIGRRMAGWLAWLKYAIGRKPEPATTPAEAAAVRRLYRALLAWSAAGGCPRRRHQTPHEFLARLCEWAPEARDQLALITEHYAAVRYGNRRPSADVVKALERMWQDVRQMRRKPMRLKRVFQPGRNEPG